MNMIMMLAIAGAGVYFVTKKTPALPPSIPNPSSGSGSGSIMPTPAAGWLDALKTWMNNSGSAEAVKQIDWCSQGMFAMQVSYVAGLPTDKAYQAAFLSYGEVKRYIYYNAQWPPAAVMNQWMAEAWAKLA